MHPFINYLQQNPDKLNELITLVSEDPLFKSTKEIKDLALMFKELSEDVKEDFVEIIESEIKLQIKRMERNAVFNADQFCSSVRRKDNLEYILWALKNEDVELNYLKKGVKFLYPYDSKIHVKQDNDKQRSNRTFLELADLLLSLTSPVDTMKYIVEKAKKS